MALSRIILGLLGGIILFHIVAIYKFWYWSYAWLDVPMHFLGGVWVALFFAWFSERVQRIGFSYARANFYGGFLMTLSFVALFGIGWEFYEFLYDVFLSRSRNYEFLLQLGAADTISDLFFDLLGGAVGFALVYCFLISKKRSSS